MNKTETRILCICQTLKMFKSVSSPSSVFACTEIGGFSWPFPSVVPMPSMCVLESREIWTNVLIAVYLGPNLPSGARLAALRCVQCDPFDQINNVDLMRSHDTQKCHMIHNKKYYGKHKWQMQSRSCCRWLSPGKTKQKKN